MLPTRWLSSGFHQALLITVGATCVLNGFAGGLAAERSDVAQKAKAILSQKCYSCHGEAGSADGGINFMLDRERLVKRKKLVPGKSDDSLIFRQVKAGTMPKGDEPLTAGELDTLKAWIDGGAPDFNAQAKTRTFISPDDVLALIRDDLRKLEKDDPEKLPYFRYFTIAHLYNSGLSDDELRSYRVALSKMINSLSWKKRIVVPQPIDPAQTVLRICLSDYRWSLKTWESLLAEYPYGVKSSLSAVQFCYTATQTKVPCVRADWFVAKVALPPLYHEILELPESAEKLEQLLRIDTTHNIASGDATRLAFNGSGVSTHNRLIERHECDLTGGAYWKSYDFSGVNGSRNLFSHPLGPGGENGFEHDGGELIFNLPNGLQAYLLVDGRGRRIDKGPIEVVSDPRRPDRLVVNGLSCMSCHAEGVKRKKDEVRDAILANPQAFTAAEVSQVKKLYKPSETLEKLFDEDANRFATAVARTGGKTTGDEPIVMLAMRFEEELDVDTAAAEAGVTTQQFKTSLGKSANLSRQLPTLMVAGGTVKRDLFVAMFPTLVRELRLGQSVGSTSAAIASRGAIPDIPNLPAPKPGATKPGATKLGVAKPGDAKLGGAKSKTFNVPAELTTPTPKPRPKLSPNTSLAPVTLDGFDKAIKERSFEYARLRRLRIDQTILRLRELQSKYTKAGQLDDALAIRAVADQLAKETDYFKQEDILDKVRRPPTRASAALIELGEELRADSAHANEESKQNNLDFASRIQPLVQAALVAGDLENSRKVVGTFFSLRGQTVRLADLTNKIISLPLVPEATCKSVDQFRESAKQRLANANLAELPLRKTLLEKLHAEAKRQNLEPTPLAALAETMDFFEAEFSAGLSTLRIFRPNPLLPREAQTVLTEYLAAIHALTEALLKQHSSALELLNQQLDTARKALANEHEYEPAFSLLELSQSLKPAFEPIDVKAVRGRRPYSQFTWEAQVLEAKEGSFLLRDKKGSGSPEWGPRDKFIVGRGSGDSVEAMQEFERPAKGTFSSPPGAPAFPSGAQTPGEPLTPAIKLAKGDHVLHRAFGNAWYKATVVEESQAGVIIHYDGFSDIWDVLVVREVLRLKKD